MFRMGPKQRSAGRLAKEAQKMAPEAAWLLLALGCLLLQVSQSAAARANLSRPTQTPGDDDDDLLDEEIYEQRFPECGAGKPVLSAARSLRVAGGFDAQLGEYPSYVFLYIIHETDSAACGGTILSPNIVLTAAHCVRKVQRVFVQPTLARPDEDDYDSWFEAEKICVDEKFRVSKGLGPLFDVAILRLERPLVFSENVNSACLASLDISEETQAIAVGLGLVHGPDQPRRFAHTLQVLPVKRTVCDMKHGTKICFEANVPEFKGDTCAGDSGGPIYAQQDGKLTVFGATSSGPEVCHNGTVGVSENAHIFRLRRRINRLIDQCEK